MSPPSKGGVTDGCADLEEIEGALTRLFPERRIARVLLVNPPDSHAEMFQYDTAKRGRYTNYPPYGLMILARNLREAGVETEICNLNHEVLKQCHATDTADAFDYDATWGQALDAAVAEFAPDLVCVTCMFTMTHSSFKRVCERVVSKEIPLAIGGVHVSNDVDRILDDIPGACLAFLREGEIALTSFIRVVNGEAGCEDLAQLVIDEGGKRYNITREKQPTAEDCNLLPSWDLAPPEENAKYGTIGSFYYLKPGDTRFATILSNRGCRAQCTFCSVRSFNGAGVRLRDVSSVVDELERLENDYGVSHVMWLDDDLLKNESRAISLFNEMVRRGLKLTWDTTNGVIAISCTEEVVAACAESGCIGMNIGMESGNPEILKQIRKPGKVTNFLKAAEALRKHEQIYASIQLMVGFPGETMSMVMDTIEVAREMDLDWCRISPLQPLANTPIYESMLAQGLIDDVGSSEVRFAAGAFGKQAEIEQGLRLATADFKEVFSTIGLDQVPDADQITDIWFYMNYHLNFHRLFHEDRPLKVDQQIATLINLSDLVAPENAFALYFLGFLSQKRDGAIPPSVIERLSARLETSEYWQSRFSAFGLSADDLCNNDFRNKHIPRLLPKGYSNTWAA
ncbi:MAG: radical SAM protein [Alphaproteobacteria bacterium]|nr:radical SAM protein [Alphaproteobacteria bacterium]